MGDDKRSLRLLKLLTCLRGKRFRSVEELARRFKVTARTVYRDLADLELDWPIERDEEGSGARLPPGAELPPIHLSVEETALLRTALEQPLLRRERALAPLARSLVEKLAVAVRALEETPTGLKLAPVDRSGPGAELALGGLGRAIEQGRAVEIVYESLSGRDRRARPRGLDPWQVFHRGDAWYVVGFCRVHREPRIFRLDRISAVGVLDERARPPEEGFDLEAFLEGSWAVFFGRGRHEVVLEFDAALAPLVANARHHAGESKRVRADGAVEYRVTLNALDEVARWVVGFGGGVRVAAPPELRSRVVALSRATLKANDADLRAPAPGARPEEPAPRRRRRPLRLRST
jgi:predicted DNA-binding transcriptional regulator YafY